MLLKSVLNVVKNKILNCFDYYFHKNTHLLFIESLFYLMEQNNSNSSNLSFNDSSNEVQIKVFFYI